MRSQLLCCIWKYWLICFLENETIMYTVKALRRSCTPPLTLTSLFLLKKNFCSKNLLIIMIASRNDCHNNDYNKHTYENRKLAIITIFRWVSWISVPWSNIVSSLPKSREDFSFLKSGQRGGLWKNCSEIEGLVERGRFS